VTGVTFDVVNDATTTEPSADTPPVITVRPPPDTLLAAEADLGRFVLAWYDATTAAWQILPTTVNADGTLSAESDHPGPLALLEAITAPPEPDSSDIPVAED